MERRSGHPSDGQQPFGSGVNTPRPAEIQATHGPPVKAALSPVESPRVPESLEIEIVDITKLEERREHTRARKRERQRRYYQKLKQAVLSGDEGAIKRWERLKEQNRQAHRRWRTNHPEQVQKENRKYYRLRRSRND